MSQGRFASVLKPRIAAAAAAVLVIVAFGVPFSAPTVEAQGRPTFESLHNRLLPLFELAGVVFTDADETTGRFVVGVQDEEIRGLIRARLSAIGVPFQSVDIVETDAILPVTTLRDNVRPVVGGLQIRYSGYLCSLSFNAVLNGVAGYVTAAHCSDKQGAADGTLYYQPLNQVIGEFIGQELFDPAFFRSTNGCSRGKRCRYSDANFSDSYTGATFDLGMIAMTTGSNTGSLTMSGSFSITGEGTAAVGSAAHKVGRTTGWTQGKVTRTCVNTAVSGSNILLLCQTFVEQKNVQIVAGGDSGSPVFVPQGGTSVTLLGTLWGGNSTGTQFVYSPIANIESELGALTTSR